MRHRGMSKSRIAALAVVAVLAALATIIAGARTAPEQASAATKAAERPNIVVIETDDQTVEQMRFLKNTRSLIADEGVTFDSSFVSYSLCCPSRSTFLTGQYAHNHGVMGNSPPNGGYTKFNPSGSLPIALQQAGYHTVMVGKYLNGYGARGTQLQVPPGWSEWYGATKLPFLGFTINQNGTLHTYPADQANYQTDVFARLAVDAIRRNAASASPFFIWLTPHAPHSGAPRDPDDPPGAAFRGPNVAAKYRDALAGQSLPTNPAFNEADVSDKPAAVRNRRLLTQAQISALTEDYQQQGESLLSVDDAVTSVVDTLRSTGELANTLIIFTDDNGFMHGEHRIPNGKVVVYEPSIRVPLVMRGPGIPHGRHVTDVVANIDLAPTILDAANAKPMLKMDGRSLLPLARNTLANYGRDLLLETPQYTGIRTDRFKYVEYRTGERELYDLKTDPFELQNRAGDSSLAAIQSELASRLAKLRTCAGASCRQGPRVALRVAGRRTCRVSLAGADLQWVTSVRFYRGQKRVKTDTTRPFSARLARHATVHALVSTRDGRSAALARACR